MQGSSKGEHTTDGFDTKLCRKHREQLRIHGSPYKKSYKAEELAPHRKAALAWVKSNREDSWVKSALERVQALYNSSGPHVEAFRLNGLTPRQRANAHWARLRKGEADPCAVVAAWLAVEIAIRRDPFPASSHEYKLVQAAKLVHRMESGSHRKWGDAAASVELHVYPRSRGRVLRLIGKDLQKACEFFIEKHRPAIEQMAGA